MLEQSKIPPDLDDLLAELKNEIFATLNCVQIGKIEKVNSNQTVEIQLQVKRRVAGRETVNYPLLVDCPYVVLSGGGSYIDMPITAGDYCIVLFNDRNIGTWWDTANVKEPQDTRKHNLSDGLALVGINPADRGLDLDGTWVRILGKSGPGAEQPAARQSDAITVDATTDPAFFTFLQAVASALGLTAPTTVTGKISSGSTGVKIG